MIQLLLEEGANPMGQSEAGETPLHMAAKHCHCAVVKMLLRFVEQNRTKEQVSNYVNLKNTVSPS